LALGVGGGAAEDEVFLGAGGGDVEDAEFFGEALALEAGLHEDGCEGGVADALVLVDG